MQTQRDPRTVEPRNTAQALLMLDVGTTLERKADEFPEWALLLLQADGAQLDQYAQVLADAFVEESETAKYGVPLAKASSHIARARASWTLAISPHQRQNLLLATHKAPLFVRRRLRHVGRLTAGLRKCPSVKNEARRDRAWSQVRQYAMKMLEESEAACDALLDGFWLEFDRLSHNIETAAKCGARCRTGKPCQMKVHVWPDGRVAKRCRLHGGASTGPKTAAGRAAIGEANRRRVHL